MPTSLSSLVDNMSEVYKKECKLCKERKKIMSQCILIGLKNNRLHYKCKECNDRSYKSINGLIKKFLKTYQFCNGDVNKFVLLLQKGVCPYEYTDRWEKFNDTSILDKEAFYSKLNDEALLMKTMLNNKRCLKNSGKKVMVIIMTCMFKVIHYCL